MIIGLSGTPASGKDTVGSYLVEKKGFNHVSLSAVLRSVLKEKGIEINAENLNKVGNSMAEDYGKAFLVELAKEIADFNKDLVISSVRQPGEIERLKEEKNFFMIFVDADIEIRYKRMCARGRQGDCKTLDGLKEIEKAQMDGSHGGMNLTKCKEMADYVIENNGTMEEFDKKIEDILGEIEEKIKD